MGHGQAGKQGPLRSTWCLLLCLSCATAGASSWMRGRLWRCCQLCCTGPEGGLGGQSEQAPQSNGGVWIRGLSRKEEGQGTRWQHYFVGNTEVSWSTWTSLDIRSIVPLLLSHSTKTWYFLQRRSWLGLFLYLLLTHTLCLSCCFLPHLTGFSELLPSS